MSSTGDERRRRKGKRATWRGWEDPHRPVDRTIEVPKRKPTKRRLEAEARADAMRAAKLMRVAMLDEVWACPVPGAKRPARGASTPFC